MLKKITALDFNKFDAIILWAKSWVSKSRKVKIRNSALRISYNMANMQL